MGMGKHASEMVAEAKTRIENLTVDEVEKELEAGAATVIDIRDVRELYESGAVPGSVHAPRGMLEFWIDPESEYHRDVFDPDKRYILYCAAGMRSALAADTMRAMGYRDVAHMESGFSGWESAGKPVEDKKTGSKWVKRSDI